MADITLNGQDYKLDESGEGEHYKRSHQPLRPPNAQLVQGVSGKFQLRPDLLQWSWTDWSSGENQIKINPSNGGRAYLLQNVNPFRRRGELSLGYKASLAQDSTGASDFAVPGTLVKAYGSLFHVSSSGDDVYEWDGSKFGAAETITSATVGSDPNSAVGDQEYLFVHETGTTKIHRRDSGGTWTNHNDQCGLTGEVILVELGAYVYVYEPLSGKVYEISKLTANTADPEVEIHNVPINSAVNCDQWLMVAGDNRVYLAVSINGETYIHEIVPSSAAGTGFGSELSKVPGITAEALFYSGGTVFFIGYDTLPDASVGPDRQVFYVDPQGTYGTLGSVRGYTATNGPSSLYPVPAAGRLALSAFALPPNWLEASATSTGQMMGLFEIDQISGGMAAVGGDTGRLVASPAEQATSLVWYGDKYFASLATKHLYWEPNVPDTFSGGGTAVSPANDFGLAGEKILEKIEIVCDPLPATAGISVGYQLDGGSWVNTLLVTTTGATGAALQVSTDSTTKTFRSMKLRTTLAPPNPIVKSIDAFARVNRRLRVWDLIIDLADDTRAGHGGAKLLTKLSAISENSVVAFVDKYLSHDDTDGGTSLDVIVDSLNFVLDRPGEGQAHIRLVEVL